MGSSKPMIVLSDVSFRYKDSEQDMSVRDIDLRIAPGEAVLLCGQSGCGKTTVTRLINGLIPQFYEGDLWGTVTVADRDVSVELVNDTARIVGSVFQNPKSQFFAVDTESELAFGCENLGWAPSAIEQALKRVVKQFGIEALLDKNLFRLSGGEKQKIACASISASNPEVIVLDEPASNLDVDSIRMLGDIMARWKGEGKTLVVAEHRLSYLMDVADRVIFMESGAIGWDRPIDEVKGMDPKEMARLGLRPLVPSRFKETVQGLEATRRSCRKAHVDTCDSQTRRGEEGEGEDIVIRGISFTHKDSSFSGARRQSGGIEVDELRVPCGSIVGIVGHNGAGKTTFARCLCGLEKQAKGTLSVSGKVYGRKERRKLCYLVMQDVNHQLFTESVREEVVLGMAEEESLSGESRIDAILHDFDLQNLKDLHPLSLSGGQKQRIALAGAVATRRRVMVFDEPTSGLDRHHMQETACNLRALRDEGITSLIITHDPELIAECCNWIVFVEEGRLSWSGPLDGVGAEMLDGFFYA